MPPSLQPFADIPPTLVTPITCPKCRDDAAHLVGRALYNNLECEMRTFECKGCGNVSIVTIPS